jgi:hypothetical protein
MRKEDTAKDRQTTGHLGQACQICDKDWPVMRCGKLLRSWAGKATEQYGASVIQKGYSRSNSKQQQCHADSGKSRYDRISIAFHGCHPIRILQLNSERQGRDQLAETSGKPHRRTDWSSRLRQPARVDCPAGIRWTLWTRPRYRAHPGCLCAREVPSRLRTGFSESPLSLRRLPAEPSPPPTRNRLIRRESGCPGTRARSYRTTQIWGLKSRTEVYRINFRTFAYLRPRSTARNLLGMRSHCFLDGYRVAAS